jgi:hypothetical protein
MKHLLTKLHKTRHFLYCLLCTVVYKVKLWNINADYAQLDIDMMCTTMTYKEYCEEQKLIDMRYDALINGE